MMWELDCEESWAQKNWYFWTAVLEKTLESPLDCKEIKPVNPKGNQPWIFIGRTDAEALILWPPNMKCWLIGKDPDAGKDWVQEKGVTEDGMVGWHHQLSGHEFGQTLGDGVLCCTTTTTTILNTFPASRESCFYKCAVIMGNKYFGQWKKK